MYLHPDGSRITITLNVNEVSLLTLGLKIYGGIIKKTDPATAAEIQNLFKKLLLCNPGEEAPTDSILKTWFDPNQNYALPTPPLVQEKPNKPWPSIEDI